MALIGYKRYSYKSGWWIFSTTKYAYFLEVDDGHSDNDYNNGRSVYYDPEGVSNSGENVYVYDHTA